MRFYLYKGDRPSDGARALVEALQATTLRANGSSFTGRGSRAFINWGCSSPEAQRLYNLAQTDRRFNNPQAIANATNKLRALLLMREAGVQIVPFWENAQDAMNFASTGGRVYARHRLSGHSGEGIELIMSANDPQADRNRDRTSVYIAREGHDWDQRFNRCQLFTQGITGERNEYRVHVFQGRVIQMQKKVRRSGFQENGQYTSLIRNLDSGWIYAVGEGLISDGNREAAGNAAIQAVRALGLAFGAVDIIRRNRDGQMFVLEVNTAPGLGEGGSTIRAYTEAFQAWAEGFTQGEQA